uniref:Uncharacterized protein n=1 Tax=Anguilla anguilla TaxID=7936 RepID=A0A0E9QS06_ANGAN
MNQKVFHVHCAPAS